MTQEQIEKMVEVRNAAMNAENEARGAYFAAAMRRAESIGRGEATQAEYDAMMALKADWENMKAVA